MKKTKRIMSMALASIIALGMIFATGCSKKEVSTADSLVVTVNDQKVYLDEMMYYIYAMEANVNQYEELYQQYYQKSYWDMEIEEGVTVRDQVKDYIMDTAVMYTILYDKAVSEGYKLTDEEKTTAEENATALLEQISEEQLKITGFTKDSLIEVQEKLALGEKYYNTIIEGLEIDEDAVKKTINKEDYRQFNTEYLFVSTVTFDEKYNQVDLSDDEKAAAKKVITSALEKAKSGTELSDIASELSTDDITVTTNTLNFVKDDGSADEAYQTAAILLENGDVADGIVETDTGYYVIKMVDNNNTESYDKAVSEAITNAQNDAFTAKYEEIKKDYTITENDEVWGPLVMGTITIVQTKSDDSSKDSTDDSTIDDSNTNDSSTDDSTSDNTTSENK